LLVAVTGLLVKDSDSITFVIALRRSWSAGARM
jgi:hypothetical protein